jgi:hypothetical protein
MTFANRDAGINRLRIFNPNESDAVAFVAGVALDIPAGQIVERADVFGNVIVRSTDALIVSARMSDVSDADAPNATHDAQIASSDLHHPAIAPLAITTQTCGTTTLISTASVACKGGTSTAMVDAIPGATFEWSGVNVQILNGLGTNVVTLSMGQVANASISVIVHTPDGCTLNGTASIAVRDPFAIATFTVSPSNPHLGDTVTVSWTYTTTESPKTQTLTLTAPNGTPTVVNVPLANRSYTFVASATGSWNASFLGSLIGGRRRAVRSGTSALPAPSPCYQGSASKSFTVSNACIPGSGSVSASSQTLTQGNGALVTVTANAAWTLRSALNNPLSQTSGTGNVTVVYTATFAGTDTLTLDILGECGTVTRTTMIVVNTPPVTVTITADNTTVLFGASTTLHVVIGNAPPGAYTYVITSSRGNNISLSATQAGDSLTFRYVRDNDARVDTVTLTVMYNGRSPSGSIDIH